MAETDWRVEIANPAERDIRRLAPDVRRRVLSAFRGLAVIPRRGDIKKLRGTDNEYRLRVGDWRAIFEVDGEERVVRILVVAHRRDAYRE
ncbi:MAG: type II toxin-antitoxin system RelE/ParE family toxin [Thermomicrobiales bacterium]|nr:type II toxin-antitoxin system RelE/ParE family toxin [Thermomicrobiales bacterium]